MPVTKIHILPVIVFALIPSSFLITYSIAVTLNHVEADFPYISDTGTHVPESCIFSQFVNLIAAFLALTMYFRYKLIEQHYRDHLSSESTTVLKVNFASIIIGWIGCFCVSVLSNFQETSVIIVHITASLTAFGCGAVYCWLQAIISYYMCPLLNSVLVLRLRCLLAFLVSASFFSSLVAGIIARQKFHGNDPTKWYPKDGGFVEHVISTASEWILVMSFDVYMLTFVVEMKRIAVSSPQVFKAGFHFGFFFYLLPSLDNLFMFLAICHVHFIFEDLVLQANEFYNSEDRLSITQSRSSGRANSAPTTPYEESNSGGGGILRTQGVIH